jgi:hypothetical protein
LCGGTKGQAIEKYEIYFNIPRPVADGGMTIPEKKLQIIKGE